MNRFINPTAKVFFRVPNEDGTAEVESLWAQDLGNDRFRLDNCPFFAYGVSLHDIVLAPPDSEGLPTFESVLSKSGNRTIRIIFDEPAEDGSSSKAILDHLVSLGCGYEGANRRYIAVNIPSSVELSTVRNYLAEQHAEWEHADPTYDEVRAGA
jgi:hypothetical protein